jgi:hypothetical protein
VYRDLLYGHFILDGASSRITQRIAEFPVFDILIVPIKRVETSQPSLRGRGALP